MDNSILTTSAAPSLAPVENSISLTGGSLILSRTTSGAEGAAIEVITDTLNVTKASQIVSSNEGPAGLGGNINITATKSVTISGYDEAGTSGVVSDLGFSWGYNKTSGIFAGTIGDGQGSLDHRDPQLTLKILER
jgi:hypothetical protein